MRVKLLLVFLFGILFSLNLIMADFTIGNISHSITSSYGPSELISGWINISLQNEPTDSLLTGFNKNKELLDFLEENSMFSYFSCFPSDCEGSYKKIDGSGEAIKNFYLEEGEDKIIGLKLEGELEYDSIESISFKAESNADKSCNQPLKVDILNDQETEWKSYFSSPEFICFESNSDCFNSSAVSENLPIYTEPYCQKIELPTLPIFKIGANIIIEDLTYHADLVASDLVPKFIMEVFDKDFSSSLNGGYCEIDDVSVSGKYSCTVSLNLTEPTEVYVCINADIASSLDDSEVLKVAGTYTLPKEEESPTCGFYSDYFGEQTTDYDIFIKGGMYDSLSEKDLIFDGDDTENFENLIERLNLYLNNKYDYDCTGECLIPIKFTGLNQQITLSDLILIYNPKGRPPITENYFYEVNETVAKINSDFIELNLEKANISVPSDYGVKEFVLKLGDSEILKESISVQAVPKIKDVQPHEAPALVPVAFSAVLDGIGEVDSTYIWDFGDDTPKQTTNVNIIEHTYPEVNREGYALTINISNKFGSDSKTVQIEVIPPGEAIQEKLAEYKENLENIEREINNLPAWISSKINKKVDLEKLANDVNAIDSEFTIALESQYRNIIIRLYALMIPSRLEITQTIDNPNFFNGETQLDLEILELIGAGTSDKPRAEYIGGINSWLTENLEISMTSETHSFFYGEGDSNEDPIISHIKVTLKPKKDIDSLYFVINEPNSSIEFKTNLNLQNISGGVAVKFSGLTEDKTFEFLYPGKINSNNLPFYVSPKLTELGVSVEVEPCNYNKICEKELGENYKNCREDCKPLGWMLLLFGGLFFITFIIYIVLQEWYKKQYESKLFPNRNQLFNLINFMNNSLNQGLEKSKIFAKLSSSWSGEQLRYAWRKLHGKRTGMWEIPLFKRSEKKEVKKELEKRQTREKIPRSFPSKKLNRPLRRLSKKPGLRNRYRKL